MDSVAKILALNVGWRTPTPKDEALSETLSAWIGDAEARDALSVADEARAAMVAAVESEHVEPQQQAAGLMRYLPLARTACASWAASPAASGDRSPKFWWKTGMGGTFGFKQVDGLAQEVSMTIAAIAAAHALAGMNLAHRELNPDYKGGAAAFCRAAGAFDALAKSAVGGAGFNLHDSPLELSAPVAEGLRDLCMGAAHRLTVAFSLGAAAASDAADATIKGGALKAKLCAGYVAVLENAIASMRANAGAEFEQLQTSFRLTLAFQVAIGRGLMWFFAAHGHLEKDESGKAIYCAKQAMLYLRERPSLTATGHPPLTGFLEEIAGAVEAVRGAAAELERQAERDNNTVYFQSIPEELPPPTAATVMKIAAFEMPPSAAAMMHFVPASDHASGGGSFGPALGSFGPTLDLPPPSDAYVGAPVLLDGDDEESPAATPSSGEANEADIETVVAMGFDRDAAVRALTEHGDVELAINSLLS